VREVIARVKAFLRRKGDRGVTNSGVGQDIQQFRFDGGCDPRPVGTLDRDGAHCRYSAVISIVGCILESSWAGIVVIS
jgi:hypothetical protein